MAPGFMLGVAHAVRFEEAPVSGQYAGRQIVGMDLHRRRSVLVRMTESGQRLETVRISNDPEYLRQVMARAGEAPEVVLEATYGWYWAADTLAELGAHVHLAHPLGVRMFSYRRVKNDLLTELADRSFELCMRRPAVLARSRLVIDEDGPRELSGRVVPLLGRWRRRGICSSRIGSLAMTAWWSGRWRRLSPS